MIQTKARLQLILAVTAMIAPVLTPESRDKLIAGSGIVATKLTGADFEFLERAAVSKDAPPPSAPAQTHVVLPLSKRAGEQHTVDVDTAARGAYVVLRRQSAQEPPPERLSRSVRPQARDNGP